MECALGCYSAAAALIIARAMSSWASSLAASAPVRGPHGPTILFNTLESFLRIPTETSPVIGRIRCCCAASVFVLLITSDLPTVQNLSASQAGNPFAVFGERQQRVHFLNDRATLPWNSAIHSMRSSRRIARYSYFQPISSKYLSNLENK
jgi:hypothetical protein